jgi:hypothetical protein
MVQIRKKELEVIERSLRDGIELASKEVNKISMYKYFEIMPNSPIAIRYKTMLNALDIVQDLKAKAKVESCQILLNETDGIDP